MSVMETSTLFEEAYTRASRRCTLYPSERKLVRELFNPDWFFLALVLYIKIRWLSLPPENMEEACSDMLSWMGEADLFPKNLSSPMEVMFGNVLFEAAAILARSEAGIGKN